jgi:hypothetical protein
MLESKWEIDNEQGKGWNYTGNEPSLFYQDKINPLEANLIEFLKTGTKSNGEIFEFTLKQRFLPKHTNEILNNWQQNNRLEVVLQNGQKARKGAFYNSYRYYKNDFSKVLFFLR